MLTWSVGFGCKFKYLKKNARLLYIFEYSTGQNPQFEIEDSLILNLKLRIQYPYSLQDGFV
jgi:hypothetical protein